MPRCTSRGCVFGACSGRRSNCKWGSCQRGYAITDDFYSTRGRRCCLGPRARIDKLKTFGDCFSCHGCKPNTRLNIFDQYNLEFDQLFVGWSRNCPCRGGISP